MGALKSRRQRIMEAHTTHSGKYDYTLWPNVVRVHDRVSIICPIHGVFVQLLGNHINAGHGCPACGYKVKRKETNRKTHGTEEFISSQLFKEKRRETMLAKYGTEHVMSNPAFIAKREKTNIEKYGVPHPSALSTVQEKRASTNQRKYGTKIPQTLDTVKTKAKQTNIIKYGVAAPQQSHEIRQKSLETISTAYGVDNVNRRHISASTLEKLNNKEWLFNQHVVMEKPLIAIAEELKDVSATTVTRYAHKHGIDIQHFIVSIGESEVAEWLQQAGVSLMRNTRSVIPPHELDVYLPDMSIAIEFNGNYWHSEVFPQTIARDNVKAVKCATLGITLLTIWEKDWIINSSRIKTILMEIIKHRNASNTQHSKTQRLL